MRGGSFPSERGSSPMMRLNRRLLLALLPIACACATTVVSRQASEDRGDQYVPPPIAETPPPPPTTTVVVEAPAPEPLVENAVAYYGAHPIPDAYGGGWCLVDGAHLHPFGPEWYEQYVFEN